VGCLALLAYGVACRDADPVSTYDVLRRGLRIAQDSGNQLTESHLAMALSRLAATHGDPVDAFDYLALAIRDFYDAGSFSLMYSPLAILAAVFDRLGYHEPAATISAFAANSWTRAANPELNTAITHLREVLGGEVYEAFARAGMNMTNAAMVTYAFDHIDRARAELLRAGVRD
jgi:hypothetical protein